MSDQELAVIDAEVLADLTTYRQPETVIEEARKAAAMLKRVLDAKANKVMMGGEQYLEFEDWQTVAHFYGCSVRTVDTKHVQFGTVSGFEARAEAFHMGSGKVIAGAESMCLNDEEKWSARNKYEWAYCKKSGGHSVEDPGPTELIWVDNPRQPGRKAPKKEKVLIGQEAVPLFQLRSMAQTRACAKALRNAFAWVVVLAGYRPTPAEELPQAVMVPQEPAAAEQTSAGNAGGKASVTDGPTGYEPPLKEALQEMGLGQADLLEKAEGTPADPWIAKLKTCERDMPTITKLFNSIPPELQQDCFECYQQQLRELNKKRK